MKSYKAAEFLGALQSQALVESLSIAGMVKADESNDKALMFSPDGTCESWIPVPLELIGTIDHLGTQNCKDHTHPKVVLHLEIPSESTAYFFAKVLEKLNNKMKFQAGKVEKTSASGSRRLAGRFFGVTGVAHCGNGQFIDCSISCQYDDDERALTDFYKEADYTCYNRGGLLSSRITGYPMCD